ncbi:MAG: DUF488 family protein [Armatimonadota bacterium]
MAMILYTIGYGNLTPEKVLGRIPAEAVVVDVRENPYQAWHQGYAAAGLAKVLGTRYWGMPLLGNPGRSPSAWQPMSGLLAGGILAGLAAEIRAGGVICLLCAEADAGRCHRRFVAEKLAKAVEGLEIVHL